MERNINKEQAVPDFIKNEENILNFWQEYNCFDKLVEKNRYSNKHYRFLDGPITANYEMGVHHAWNRSLKDFMLKYKAMNGYSSHYQNGFDAHGLPVELGVEKELGFTDKRDILKFGLAEFVEKCMERVQKYSGIITEQSKRLGQWMDWDNSYFTNSNDNITAIWYFLKKCHENGWLIEKFRPLPWCAHCGTSLSEHELADSYKDLEHMAVFFKAPIKGTNRSMLVWTTTPWTLSANVAVAVNEDLEYVVCKVKSDSRLLIVGKQALKILKDDYIETVETIKGSSLVGLEYETCFKNLQVQDFVHKIVGWEQVDALEGSGAVHIAPGCGAEDFELGQKLGLPNICPIDENGIFYDNYSFLSGKKAQDVPDLVFEKLTEQGRMYYTHKHKHRYPTCDRCKNPLVFRLTKEWYIKADEIRPKLIAAIETVQWQPEFLKKRMLDWLTNMGDWSISRKRFYGIPLPFYRCEKCGELIVVGSLEELKKLSSSEEVEKIPHLHRPYIDNIKITCPCCGEKIARVTEVGDCWLDAGKTPFSTKKYFTDKEFFEKNFPAECVMEMKEQVRLWFYSLLFMSVTLVDKAPYEKVIGFATLVSEDGSKFSKSGKNNIKYFEAANKIGSDVIRYMYACNNMLNDTRFGYSICDELRRKLMGLWNAYVFYITYAIIDKPNLEGFIPKAEKLDITDKWLIEKTNKLIEISKTAYEQQQFFVLTKEFESYIDDLSNWYIRVNRRRFWKSEDEDDKLNAYYCLYNAIKCVLQVMSPIIPFMTEHIWQNMVRGTEADAEESIFLSDYPKAMLEMKYDGLVEKTQYVRDILTIAQRLRNENQIKIKQPLKKLYLIADDSIKNAVKEFEGIILSELNIKEIVFEKDINKFNDAFISVNFKTAGAYLKGDVQTVKNLLSDMNKDEMAKLVDGFNNNAINIDSFQNLPSNLFNLMYMAKSDFVIATENGMTVVLDITIDENLLLEGLSRELIRSIQLLRKEADFDISQRVDLQIVTSSDILNKVIEKYMGRIKQEVLVKEFAEIKNPDIEKTITVSDDDLLIKLKKS